MADAQDEVHETMPRQRQWTETTEGIPGRGTASIPQRKRNDGARRVEQSSVRYGSIGITKACREDSGMGLTKKRKEKQQERTGVRG